jgi:cellulose biosynthesis protein BcsQ
LNTNVLPNLNKVNKKIKTFVLLNQISTHALDKDQRFAREYLKQLKYLNVLKSGLKNRKSYHRNFFNGYSVFENKCKKSKLEIENLTEELLNE